ncbi:MAG: hypothetical protein NTW46_02695 [Candidatus Nealsonbacteria bacterium]|nr:hypothetical protein [Candidatus Nealsonbacteria bacterium]
MATERHKILTGPSKFDLMLALFDDGQGPRIINFRIMYHEKPFILRVSIKAVQRVGEDFETWSFSGITCYNEHAVKGCFKTDKRTGWLEY